MSKRNHNTGLAPVVSPTQSKEERFSTDYVELCRKHGLQLAYEPRWAQSKDTGDYRLIIVAILVPYMEEVAQK